MYKDFQRQLKLLTLQLVMEVLKHLDGAYALLFKSSLYPGEMVACKRGSPLILGIKEVPHGASLRLANVHDESVRHAAGSLECYVASDASAVVEHTKKCVLFRVFVQLLAAIVPALALRSRAPLPAPTPDTALAELPLNLPVTAELVATIRNMPPSAIPVHHMARCLSKLLRSPLVAAAKSHRLVGRRVVVLEDNDVLHARQGAWGIFNAKFTDRHVAVPRALETLDMEVANIMKGGCAPRICALGHVSAVHSIGC